MISRNINERITQSRSRYAEELSGRWSPFQRLDNSDFSSEEKFRSHIQPPWEHTSEIPSSLTDSYYSIPQSIPYQPRKRFDDDLRRIAEKYEIQETLSRHLCLLDDYEIVILCDDSGSMNTPVDDTNRTRWDELCEIVKIVLEIGVIFNSSGVDIYFLNRPPMLDVTDSQAINAAFTVPPRGYTPLVASLGYIFRLPITRRGRDKKVLLFIATDGAPTDKKGNINVEELEHLMVNVRNTETTHVMFLICTDDPVCVDYLVEWDRRMVNVDVTDDYFTERERIRRFRGQNYPFSRGDYIVKALVGAIVPEIDNLNNEPEGGEVAPTTD
ncbi:hypothetical protein I4U23_011702 [Adineta vaga]|nr:hypothetical protein I4U23_011702 [Adineta vaga]